MPGGYAPDPRSEIVIVVRLALLFPACCLLLLAASLCVHGIRRIALLRCIGDLGDDIVEEIELLVVGNGLLEVEGVDAFRVTRLGLGSGFGDERDHEELEGFGCGVSVWQGGIAEGEARTNNHGRHLGHLAHVIVGLHDAFYARDGEVVLDDDVVHIGRQRGAPTHAVAGIRRHAY
jgi:hypothetical protein